MNPSTLLRLQTVMREVFLDPDLLVTPQTTALDVDGWDSLSHSMLLLEIEQAFGVRVDASAAARCANLGELVGYLDSLTH
jgi:acyl carrier protein